MRRHVAGFVSLAAVCAIVACTGQRSNAPTLAPVVALPPPSPPPWILSVSPTDKADTLAQIRVIFAKPVTAVEELSGPGPRAVLDHVSIQPQLGGHFAVLTPRMIGFVPDRALPIGTRVQVTLSAGLRDLSGDVLEHDLAWTFETAPLELRDLPQLQATDEGTPAPVGLRPTLQVTTNAAVDAETLADNATLEGGGDSVDVTATLHAQPTPMPGSNAQELFDPSLDTWTYDLKPVRDLRGGTEYALKIDPGVHPSYGNRRDDEELSGRDSHVRPARHRGDAQAEPEQRRAIRRRRSRDCLYQSDRSEVNRRRGDRLARTGEDRRHASAAICPTSFRSIHMRSIRTRPMSPPSEPA